MNKMIHAIVLADEFLLTTGGHSSWCGAIQIPAKACDCGLHESIAANRVALEGN